MQRKIVMKAVLATVLMAICSGLGMAMPNAPGPGCMHPTVQNCHFCSQLHFCSECVQDPDNCCFHQNVVDEAFVLRFMEKICSKPAPNPMQIKAYCGANLQEFNPLVKSTSINTGSVKPMQNFAEDALPIDSVSNLPQQDALDQMTTMNVPAETSTSVGGSISAEDAPVSNFPQQDSLDQTTPMNVMTTVPAETSTSVGGSISAEEASVSNLPQQESLDQTTPMNVMTTVPAETSTSVGGSISAEEAFVSSSPVISSTQAGLIDQQSTTTGIPATTSMQTSSSTIAAASLSGSTDAPAGMEQATPTIINSITSQQPIISGTNDAMSNNAGIPGLGRADDGSVDTTTSSTDLPSTTEGMTMTDPTIAGDSQTTYSALGSVSAVDFTVTTTTEAATGETTISMGMTTMSSEASTTEALLGTTTMGSGASTTDASIDVSTRCMNHCPRQMNPHHHKNGCVQCFMNHHMCCFGVETGVADKERAQYALAKRLCTMAVEMPGMHL